MNKFLLSGLFFLFTQFSFSQTTVVLQASKDNTIYSDVENSNGAGPNFTCGINRQGNIRRALLKFDLSGIPAGSIITNVTLTLSLTKSKTGTDNVSLYKLNQDWGEGTSDAGDPDGQGVSPTVNDATWTCSFMGAGSCATSWTIAGGNVSSTASATTAVLNFSTTNTWSSAQMIADVQGWKNNAATNFGWAIRAGVVGGAETGSQTTNRFASKENPDVTIRPKLSVTYTSAAPVTLSMFKAAETKQGVLLNWQTASEFNNAFFSIEHSADGVTFTSIGKVNGAGSSTLMHSYQYIHQGISEGKHFYRLAQTDVNGNINYSPVVSVLSQDKHLQITISPNPVKNIIGLGGIAILPSTTYSIINSSGKIVQSGNVSSNQIAAEGLSKGFYMLRINKPGGESLSGIFVKD